MGAILERFLKNPKTTGGGLGVGAVLSGVGAYILTEAGCDFSNVSMGGLLAMLFAGPSLVGGAATDNGKAVQGDAGNGVIQNIPVQSKE